MMGNGRRSPSITALATNLLVLARFSIGCGAMFLPPAVTMRSFFRSVMRRKPSASSTPMSPVWNQPSASMRLRRRLRLVEVAAHDVGPAGQDLPVRRDLDLDPGNRPADRAEPMVLEGVHRDDRRGLGEPVALEDRQPGRVEEPGDLGGERRAAGDEEPDPPAGPALSLANTSRSATARLSREAGRHRLPLDASARPTARPPACAQKKIRFRSGDAGAHAVQHPGVDLLVQPGHRGHERGGRIASMSAGTVSTLSA